MKVYISGKITGLKPVDYLKKFAIAEKKLNNEGHEVINPAKTNATLPKSTTYEQYMDMSMLMLSMCDAIYMLNNWKDSPGANREKEQAEKNGMMVLYQEGRR